jgi:galactokinase
VSHNLATSEYNNRRVECEQALKIIQKKHPQFSFLADVPETVIESLKEKFPGKVFQRALYVSRENTRTLEAAALIQKGKVKEFGALMYQTHLGLSKKYEVSCSELDFLVDLTQNLPQVVGISSLKKDLPFYMVPKFILFMEDFPITGNQGKIDRLSVIDFAKKQLE